MTSTLPAGTDTAATAVWRRLARPQARQDHRRLAGIGRRRHPGIDAEIRRHAPRPASRTPRRCAARARRRRQRRSRPPGSAPARAARYGSRSGEPRRRPPGLERLAPRAARARHGRATARSDTDRRSPVASSSAIAVAGRCGRPLLRSSRRSAVVRAREAARTAAERDGRRGEHEEDEQRRWRARSAAATARARARRRRGTARPRSRPRRAPATAAPTECVQRARVKRARQQGVGDLRRRRIRRWLASGIGRSVKSISASRNLPTSSNTQFDRSQQATAKCTHCSDNAALRPRARSACETDAPIVTARAAAGRAQSARRPRGAAAPAPIRRPAPALPAPARACCRCRPAPPHRRRPS